jgi:hypothetical protein
MGIGYWTDPPKEMMSAVCRIREFKVERDMAPSISALSPKEEENVKEVLGMRCRAACRPYLEGMAPVSTADGDFTECATGRTISMAWACRQKRRRMMDCIQA